jgi:hypothetical protein
MKVTNWIGIINDYHCYAGFVYKITNLISNKIYFGRKYLFHPITKKETRWKTYKSSSKYIYNDLELYGESNFEFKIIKYFIDYKELYDYEISLILQHWNEANCYNKNAGGKYLMDDDTKKKIRNTFKKNGHPMKGKVHPNKGKKINSGHSLNKGKVAYTNGIKNTFIHLEDVNKLDKEWIPGITYNNKSREDLVQKKINLYNISPNTCKVCNNNLEYKQRNRQTCSRACSNKMHSNKLRSVIPMSGRNNPSWSGKILHTPAGIFDTANEASKYLNISAPTIRSRCQHSNLVIKKRYNIPNEYIGKTWKDIGYYFLDETFTSKN